MKKEMVSQRFINSGHVVYASGKWTPWWQRNINYSGLMRKQHPSSPLASQYLPLWVSWRCNKKDTTERVEWEICFSLLHIVYPLPKQKAQPLTLFRRWSMWVEKKRDEPSQIPRYLEVETKWASSTKDLRLQTKILSLSVTDAATINHRQLYILMAMSHL